MKKNRRKNQNKIIRKGHKNEGIITVFVTLIMVPVVVITGIFVDAARLKMYSSQAVMAADSYGDAVLSQFDNLLKELYGLFSVAQGEDGKKAIDQLADYVGYSFHPAGDGKKFSGFMPYQNTEVKVVYENVPGASLSNNNVLETQIADFMRFRVAQEVLEGAGVLDTLEQFTNMDSDMDAMETRKDITDNSKKILGKIDDYYNLLKEIGGYPAYLDNLEEAYQEYRNALVSEASSEQYQKYLYYLENSSTIDAAYKKVEDYINAKDQDSVPEPTTEEWTMHDEQYVDADQYKEKLDSDFDDYQTRAEDRSNPNGEITFDNLEPIIEELGQIATELRSTLDQIKNQVNSLKAKFAGCSEEVRVSMENEIKDLEKIANISDDFYETYDLIANQNQDIQKNKSNKTMMQTSVAELESVFDKLKDGKLPAGYDDAPVTVYFLWYDFMDNKRDFYEQLEALCGSSTDSGKGNKDAGDEEIEKADQQRENAENQLKGDETPNPGTRDISDSLASQLKSGGTNSEEVPGILEYFSGGLSFDALGGAGTAVMDKFLVATYDFGMFSSRVSGIKPKDNENGEGGIEDEDSSEEYTDYSLTKVKMSKDVNYLYGAELEYLFGGHNSSKSNLNEVRNIICGVRLTLNFTSSYLIDEVNAAINSIANLAAEAVAASIIGAAAAPLVRVTVSGALRLAFATIETAADWTSLKERKSTVLLKLKMQDLQSADLSGLLGASFSDVSKEESSQSSPKLAYEDYLYILMCLLVDSNTLLTRTANLITLNVNQAKNSEDILTTLDFKLDNTVTAVKSTCKVKADFVIVPENMAEMFISGSGTASIIKDLEGSYFGYSIIRGY